MSVAIIDHLEIIQVDEDQPGARPIPPHIGESSIELALKASAVEDVKKRIRLDLLLQMTDTLARSAELGIEFLEPRPDLGQRKIFLRTTPGVPSPRMLGPNKCRSTKRPRVISLTPPKCLKSLVAELFHISLTKPPFGHGTRPHWLEKADRFHEGTPSHDAHGAHGLRPKFASSHASRACPTCASIMLISGKPEISALLAMTTPPHNISRTRFRFAIR